MTRRLLALVAAAFMTALVASPALAGAPPGPGFQKAAEGLKSHPVYVAPDADANLSPDQAQQLDQQILKDNVPVYVAVLPNAAAQEVGVDNLPKAVGELLGRSGVYAVVAGHHFRAGSNGVLAAGEAGSLATAAFQAHNPGSNGGALYPMLKDYVQRVDYTLHPADKPKSHTGTILLIVLLSILAVVVLAVVVLVLVRRQRKQEEERAAAEATRQRFEQAKRDRSARLSRVQDQVLGFSGTTNAQAKSCHDDALGAAARASDLIDRATTIDDLSSVDVELGNAEAAVTDCQSYQAGNDPVKERAAAEAARLKEAELVNKQRAKDEAAAERERKKLAAKVKPSNYSPVETQSVTHNNYYGGGYYQGQYYGPGYYADPFWTWVVMDELLDNDNNVQSGGYDQDSSSSGGDWGGSSSSSSDTDFGSSSSGGDWGGGSSGGGDFGGGGGDFGGGGDSGGGGGGD